MRYLSEDDVTQMMGIGALGEVRQGPDGNLYQYVQGVDGLGNPLGFWRKLKRFARRVVRKALPIAQQFAPFIPGGAAALTAATPFLKQAGVAGYDGLGALYQAPDGTLYQQVQGLAEDEELQGLGEEEITQMMGIGALGEVRQGPDGNLYQYVQGVDGLGNPIGGFWSKLKKLKRGLRTVHRLAQRGTSFIPGPYGAAIRSGLKIATPLLKRAGVAGYGGPAEDEELQGLAEDEELQGLEEDEELQGLEEDEELQGFAGEDELRGFEANEDMQGVNGYVRQDGMSGLEAYVPQEPPQTRMHVSPTLPPEVWKTLW